MPTLLDHIDRFVYTAQSIQTAARAAAVAQPTPFVRAVLRTPLGDLARDVDASELGLFTLVLQPSAHAYPHAHAAVDDLDASVAVKSEIARVEFLGATPLRRPPTTHRSTRLEEKEPEMYAEAALKYLDRYQSIRPMPRVRQEVESIITHLNTLRSEIAELSAAVDQSTQTGTGSAPTTQDEEKRIQKLKLRIKQMKARKEVLKRQTPAQRTTRPAASKAKDKEEDAFWSDPAPRLSHKKPPRARKSLLIPSLANVGATMGADDSLLLDTHMNGQEGAMGMLGDVSMSSLAEAPTPLPAPRLYAPSATAAPMARKSDEEKQAGVRRSINPALVPLPSPSSSSLPSLARSPSPETPPRTQPDIKPETRTEDDEDYEGESTVVLEKPPRIATPPPPFPSPPRGTETPHAPSTPSHGPSGAVAATPGRTPRIGTTPGTARKARMRITTDVERIVAKIWSTVGDVIMPGHPFNTAVAAATNKPPRAKETIAHLQNLAAQSPPATSPSATSHSTFSLSSHAHTDPTQPSAHQILTAHLLLVLLALPHHATSLAQAKAALAAVGIGRPSDASGVDGLSLLGLGLGGQALETRALYGCVAKRLLKIDRSGREQIVRFNI